MKVMKSFRLSSVALQEISELRERYPDFSDTDIVEKALDVLNFLEFCESGTVRSLSGNRIAFHIVEK